MTTMTPEQAFRAREMHAAGLWSGRIAEVLDIDERAVRDTLRGTDFGLSDDQADAEVDGDAAEARPKPRGDRASSSRRDNLSAYDEALWAVSRGVAVGADAFAVREQERRATGRPAVAGSGRLDFMTRSW